MEETSSATSPTISSSAPTNPGDSDVPRDLRDWLARAETIGQIKRITQTVDHDEEMGAITYMAHQEIGAPALLFESIQGCPKGFRALWNLVGAHPDRVAPPVGSATELRV